MSTGDPFVRIYFESHEPKHKTEGGLFYLHTAGGKSDLAGVSTRQCSENLTYEANPDFVNKYLGIYPMGPVRAWECKDDFTRWLDSIIYYSFLTSNDQGVNEPWFVKDIPAPNAYQLTGVPIGFEQFFNQEYDSFWILLKSGSKVWLVRIINNNFRDNWSSFLKAHDVEPNFKIVFGCHKKWIFDVYVLNGSLARVMHRWNTETNFYQHLSATDYITKTSCIPYAMLTQFSTKQFGCMCLSENHIRKVFEQNLNQILRDGELKKIVLKTGRREWHVPVRHGGIANRCFTRFLYDHNLSELDFIFVGVSQTGVLQIIVFARHGGERMLEWYHHTIGSS